MLNFVKYQGAGNDFILVDNRDGKWNNLAVEQVRRWCDRRFGIGADGLIKIDAGSDCDFVVDYYNSDGSKSFCGNGARCSVAFAKALGIIKEIYSFEAIDGMHEAFIQGELVHLKMNDVAAIEFLGADALLNTGSPHYIQWVDDVKAVPVFLNGQAIRYSDRFKKEGVNVNFIQELDQDTLSIRTYERGVEDETLSCGTGITAAALAVAAKNNQVGPGEIAIQAVGGNLKVSFERNADGTFHNIWLVGPAEYVFEGVIHG